MVTRVCAVSIGPGATLCSGFIRYNPLEAGGGDVVPVMGRKFHSQKAIRSLSIVLWTT
jgi:hypothetical protein